MSQPGVKGQPPTNSTPTKDVQMIHSHGPDGQARADRVASKGRAPGDETRSPENPIGPRITK